MIGGEDDIKQIPGEASTTFGGALDKQGVVDIRTAEPSIPHRSPAATVEAGLGRVRLQPRTTANTVALTTIRRWSIVANMTQRTLILEAAESLLNASPDGEISTRAIAEAAGVGGPVLYRHFGDKNGLLRAVVDFGFDRYLSIKRAAVPAEDPVDNLRNGWDTHVAFALDHPAVYRLMYSPTIGEMPFAAGEALRILRGNLTLCAEAGLLRVEVDVAAQRIMSANVGVALSLITQPSTYQRASVSDAVRDAIHTSLLVEPTDADVHPSPAVPTVATQLAALIRVNGPSSLSDAEFALLQEWLARLSQA